MGRGELTEHALPDQDRGCSAYARYAPSLLRLNVPPMTTLEAQQSFELPQVDDRPWQCALQATPLQPPSAPASGVPASPLPESFVPASMVPASPVPASPLLPLTVLPQAASARQPITIRTDVAAVTSALLALRTLVAGLTKSTEVAVSNRRGALA